MVAYRGLLDELRSLVARQPRYHRLLHSGPLPPHMGLSGLGLDFVRQVRNKFAHGSARFPTPDDSSQGWCGRKSREPDVIALSSRIVLLSIQMLLKGYYAGKHVEVEVLEGEDGSRMEEDVHDVLDKLHLRAVSPDA